MEWTDPRKEREMVAAKSKERMVGVANETFIGAPEEYALYLCAPTMRK
jgi:hypothetical protein